MRTGTGLTIRDYFNRSNLNERVAAAARKAKRGEAFAKVLAAAGADPEETAMTILDYFKTPVRCPSAYPSMTPPAGGSEVRRAASQPPFIPGSIAPPARSEAVLPGPENEKAAIEAGIRKSAARYDLSPALIRAVVKAESNYQTRAVSPAGAQGLMQLMPATARELGVADPFDIEQNIDAGARYLRRMLDQFGGDLKQALSAYNAGPGTVARYNGDVPYAETRTYVARVLRCMDRDCDGSAANT